MAAETEPLSPEAASVSTTTNADTTAHDDRARKSLAFTILLSNSAIVGGIAAFLIWSCLHRPPGTTTSPIPADILVILSSIVTACLALSKDPSQYYYGSSSGSTSKSVALEKKTASP